MNPLRHPDIVPEPHPLFPSVSAAHAFAARLTTRALGKHIEYHRVTESTNAGALSAAHAGAPHGLVVVADEQTAGRGRRGRIWVAPPAQGLLFSVLVRYEHLDPERLGWLALAAGLAGAEAVEQLAELPATIKWPNDVVVSDFQCALAAFNHDQASSGKLKVEYTPPWRKLGGILCEGVVPGLPCGAGFVVVGMGLNVLQDRDGLPTIPKSPPTSILMETGRKVERADLLATLLMQLERRFRELQDAETFGSLRAAVEDRLAAWWLGRQLSARTASTEIQGKYAGLDEFGRLTLLAFDGTKHVLADAEIIDVR